MSQGFLYSALVFLGCAVLFVPIFQKLGLGSVLGYLLGGIAIEDSRHYSGGDFYWSIGDATAVADCR